MMTERVCVTCGVLKTSDHFRKVGKNKDRLYSYCNPCSKEKMKDWSKSNEEHLIEYRREKYEKNKSSVLAQQKEYRTTNAERIREYQKRYREENRERLSEKRSESYKRNREAEKEKNRDGKRRWMLNRRKSDGRFRMDQNVSTLIWQSLKKNQTSKGNRSWEVLVGYTAQDLITHLESKFDSHMTWENYGSYWHIDHIKPKSWFAYSSPEDPQFKECWSLANLQPLEAKQNLRKNNKYEG